MLRDEADQRAWAAGYPRGLRRRLHGLYVGQATDAIVEAITPTDLMAQLRGCRASRRSSSTKSSSAVTFTDYDRVAQIEIKVGSSADRESSVVDPRALRSTCDGRGNGRFGRDERQRFISAKAVTSMSPLQ